MGISDLYFKCKSFGFKCAYGHTLLNMVRVEVNSNLTHARHSASNSKSFLGGLPWQQPPTGRYHADGLILLVIGWCPTPVALSLQAINIGCCGRVGTAMLVHMQSASLWTCDPDRAYLRSGMPVFLLSFSNGPGSGLHCSGLILISKPRPSFVSGTFPILIHVQCTQH